MSKSGTKLSYLLEKRNPFATNCKSQDCPPCESANPNTNELSHCMVNNVCYEVKCKTCDHQGKLRTYTGETTRNLHVRSKEHLNSLKTNDQNSWMVKHISREHEGNKAGVEFSWKVVRKHNKPLQRQLHEAVRIKNKEENENLNSKSEYLGQRIKRICLDKQEEKFNFNCNTCCRKFIFRHEVTKHNEIFHKRVKCDQCEYIAIGTYDMKEHKKRATC